MLCAWCVKRSVGGVAHLQQCRQWTPAERTLVEDAHQQSILVEGRQHATARMS